MSSDKSIFTIINTTKNTNMNMNMNMNADYLLPGKMSTCSSISSISRVCCGSRNKKRKWDLKWRWRSNRNWNKTILILFIFKLVMFTTVPPVGTTTKTTITTVTVEDGKDSLKISMRSSHNKFFFTTPNPNPDLDSDHHKYHKLIEKEQEEKQKQTEEPEPAEQLPADNSLQLFFHSESQESQDKDAQDEKEHHNSRKLGLKPKSKPKTKDQPTLPPTLQFNKILNSSRKPPVLVSNPSIPRRMNRGVRSTGVNSTQENNFPFSVQLQFQLQFQWYATLLLAQQEAKCLQHFGGSQANSTSDDEYPDSLFLPFLCPSTENANVNVNVNGNSRESIQNGLQCEQCRNVTKKLMKRPEDCKDVCVGASWSCLSRCKNITEEIWSTLEQFKANCELGHETSEDLDSCLLAQVQMNKKIEMAKERKPQITGIESDGYSNSTKSNSSIPHNVRKMHKTGRGISIPMSMSRSRSLSLYAELHQQIESIDVFCEGVIPLESSSGTTGTGISGASGISGHSRNPGNSISGTDNLESGTETGNSNSRSNNNNVNVNRHFILLKTRMEIGESKRMNETSGSEEEQEEDGSEDADSYRNDVNLPVVFVVEQRQRHRQRSMQMKQVENHQNMNKSIKEQQQLEWTSWKTLGKTQYGFDKIPVEYYSNTYQWRVTVVNPFGIVDQMITTEFKTLNGYVEPSPPTKIYVLSHRVVNDALSILIQWQAPPERPCFYKIVLENQDSEDKPRTIRIKDQPLGVNRYWFENIQFGGNYGVRITSRSPSWKHEEESTHGRFFFIAPSCLEAYNFSFVKCAPPPPLNLKFTLITRNEKNGLDDSFSGDGSKTGAGNGNAVGAAVGESTKASMSATSTVSSSVNSPSVSLHLKWNAPLYADLPENQDKIQKYVVNVVSVNLGLRNLKNSHMNNYASGGKENLASTLNPDMNFLQLELNLTSSLRNDHDYNHNHDTRNGNGNGNESGDEKSNDPHLLLEEHVNPIQLSNSTVQNTFLGPFTLPSHARDMIIEDLLYNMSYSVSIVAVTVAGSSAPATLNINTKLAAEMIVDSDGIGNWVYYSIPCACILALTFSCHSIRSYIHKRKLKKARNLYFKSMEERDGVDHEWSIVPLNDDYSPWKVLDENVPRESWDVGYENLKFCEVIGEGAFGIVRRAKMPRKKYLELRNRYKELKSTIAFENSSPNNFNGKSTFYDEQDDCATETVAVKMLKGSTTKQDRDSLIKEIVTMQNLGIHQQIVTLLGVCTVGRSLCLVLEYLPGGDLLTFLRSVREKYWPMLNIGVDKKDRYFYKNGEIESRLSSSLKCDDSSSQSRSMGSSQISYADVASFVEFQSPSADFPEDSQSGQKRDQGTETEKENAQEVDDAHCRPIEEKDVLSYARQISLGMAYLERNKIVHRDLACRNVLLVGDYRQVKISDFGLSRDVYTWNVYEQKSNGKLPIKWTAIESLFSHVFTSKSDVWSYGIVLWELITLGGNPYPGISDRELFHLLKSGYRMERPENCSYILYALMKKCWRASPSDRPSFTELRRHIEAMMEATEPGLYLSFQPEIISDYFDIDTATSPTDLLDVPRRSITNSTTSHVELDSPMSSTGFEERFERSGKVLKSKPTIDCLPLKERRSTNGENRNSYLNSSTCSSSSVFQPAYRQFGERPSLHYVNECGSPLDENEGEETEMDGESLNSSTRKNSTNSNSSQSSGYENINKNKNKSENINTNNSNTNHDKSDACSLSERRNSLHLYLKPINFKTVSHSKTKPKNQNEEETDLSNLSKPKDNNSNSIQRKRLSKSLSPREHKNNTMDFFPDNRTRKPSNGCDSDCDKETKDASTNLYKNQNKTSEKTDTRRRDGEDLQGKKMRSSSMSHCKWGDSPSPGFLFPTSNHHVTSFIENRGYDLD